MTPLVGNRGIIGAYPKFFLCLWITNTYLWFVFVIHTILSQQNYFASSIRDWSVRSPCEPICCVCSNRVNLSLPIVHLFRWGRPFPPLQCGYHTVSSSSILLLGSNGWLELLLKKIAQHKGLLEESIDIGSPSLIPKNTSMCTPPARTFSLAKVACITK